VYLTTTEKEVKCEVDRLQGVKTHCLRNPQHTSHHQTVQSITRNVHNLIQKNVCCYMFALEFELKINTFIFLSFHTPLKD